MRKRVDLPAPFKPKTPILAPGKSLKKYLSKYDASAALLCRHDASYTQIEMTLIIPHKKIRPILLENRAKI